MADRYCPAYGPGSKVCPRSICDCFIDEFPDDMEQAGALHPEFFVVLGNAPGQEPCGCCADTGNCSCECHGPVKPWEER